MSLCARVLAAAALLGAIACGTRAASSFEGGDSTSASGACPDCESSAGRAGSEAGAPMLQQVSSCAPGDTSRYKLDWKPPEPLHQEKCSPEQINAFYDECLGPKADALRCSAFTDANGPLASCGACLVPPATSTVSGPVLAEGATLTVNVGGCLASFDGAVACGQAWQSKLQCGELACEVNCGQKTSAEYRTCVDQAMKSGCKKFAEAFSACISGIPRAAETCIANATGTPNDEQQFKAIATLFCGR